MGQVTIYLDDDAEARLRSSARDSGIPVSRWVADLIREKTRTDWPDEIKSLAGAWADLPDPEQPRDQQAEDVPREPF